MRLLRHIPSSENIQKLSVNKVSGDIIVNPEDLEMYENTPASIIGERFGWMREIKGEDVFLLSGLGGFTGSMVCRLIGKVFGKKKRLWGLFIYPFSREGETRKENAERTLKDVEEHYRGYILMDNDSLLRHYPNLKLEIAMEIPGVVAKHLVVDFLRMGLKNMLHKTMYGKMGIGVGFGVGKERIEIAIEDALTSPWIRGGKKIILISGNLEKEDAKYVVEKHAPIFWDVYTTEEYGEQVKATVIELQD